jgi:hypothetical protein
MVAVGSAVNVTTGLLTLILISAGAPIVVAVLVFLAPLPLNLLLVTSVWRSASQENPQRAWSARAIAFVWFIAVLLI